MTNVIELYRAPHALPAELKAIKGWLLWKSEQHFGEAKPRKVPYYIDGRRRAGTQGSPADVDALATFDRVCLAASKGGYTGIGLAILPQWGITAADFDAVIDESGAVNREVEALIACTYSEISPSGRGVRAFFTGTVPANRKDNSGSPQVEFFTSKGFVTVTGNLTAACELLGLDETMVPVTPEVMALYTARFGAGKASAASTEEIDPRLAREMLDAIDPDPSHNEWFNVALGLHHQYGKDGFELWDEWSKRGKTYPGERVMRQKWRSIRNDDANPVTFATVKKMARDAGWIEDMTGEFVAIVEEVDAVTGEVEAPLPKLSRDKVGRILATVDNLNIALRHEPSAKLKLAYDSFRDEIMFSTDKGKNWQTFKDVDYVTLRIRLERKGFKPIGREVIRDVVALVADDCKFDSAELWLTNLPAWDGVSRIATFLPAYFGAEDTPYARAIGSYIWTAMAGRIMSPGIKADMCPILVGEQGIKKSSAVAAMVPDVEYFCEISFADKDTDQARKMRGRLVAELGELRGLHTAEMERIKAFITRTHEDWTPKFKEFNTTFARRLVFVGTTNQIEFLADETGNRRWLPCRVKRADVESIVRDRLQMWAEAYAQFIVSGVAWEDAEQLGRDQHHHHMIADSWEEVVREWLDQIGTDGVKNADRKFLRIRDVLKWALNFDDKVISRKEENRMGKVLRAIGYEKGHFWHEGKTVNAWVYTKVPF